MLGYVFYSLSGLLVLSSLLTLRLPARDRVFSLSLLRVLFALPLLITQYLYFAYDFTPGVASPVMLFEAQFALAYGFMAYRLGKAMISTESEPFTLPVTEFLAGTILCVGGWFLTVTDISPIPPHEFLAFRHNSFTYYSTFLMLFSMLTMGWKLEGFWRNLESMRRWEFKFLVVALAFICCVYAWAGSYRLTYLRLWDSHFLLQAGLLTGAWLMMLYAVGRHRLLNRKIFISRKIVQASVAPALFGGYLLGLGMLTVVSHRYGWSIHFVILGMLAGLGFVGVALYWCSGRLRRRVHYFISTHFYVNKYEYRDEWLALSGALGGAISERDIAASLAQLLSDCVYASRIMIWVGSQKKHRTLTLMSGPADMMGSNLEVSGQDPLLGYFLEKGCFYLDDDDGSDLWKETAAHWSEQLRGENLVLLSPIVTGGELMGIIGLGEEYTGGRYGLDDFDLLSAMGAQTASALLASRRAEELVALREREAFNTMSSFVLHDIKNAAGMLSLLRTNAPAHIHDPEFQADMLDAVDNALKRMEKVQNHLSTLRGEVRVKREEVALGPFLHEFMEGVLKKLTGLRVAVECSNSVTGSLDKGLLGAVLENLLINALQAGGSGTEVQIKASHGVDGGLVLEVADNGPGIPVDLLPDKLFEPFQTSKQSGSGIGLWQAKAFVKAMGGTIRAENTDPGARFILCLPE